MIIRPASIFDISTVAALIKSFYLEEGYDYSSKNIHNSLELFLTDGHLGNLFLISCDNITVGYAIVTHTFCFELGGKVAYIDELFIEQQYRGKMLATNLITHIISIYLSSNYAALRLEVERNNSKASKLYSRMGFVKHNRDLMSMALPKMIAE